MDNIVYKKEKKIVKLYILNTGNMKRKKKLLSKKKNEKKLYLFQSSTDKSILNPEKSLITGI